MFPGTDEVDEARHAASRSRNLSTPVYQVGYANPPAPTIERDSDHGFVITAARNRTLSQSKDEQTKDKLIRSRSDSQPSCKRLVSVFVRILPFLTLNQTGWSNELSLPFW